MTDTKTPRQAALAAFQPRVQRCKHPGCSRLTVGGLCALHRVPAPAGQWAVAAMFKAERERGER